MKILGVIPARGGSKGVPGKNIKLLGGKPLIAHAIDCAIESGKLSRIVVSTDSEEIASVVEKYGAEVILRPSDLATDSSNVVTAVKHVLEVLQEDFDIIVLLQPTAPLRTGSQLNEVIKMLSDSEKLEGVISVVPMDDVHPARMYNLEQDNHILPYLKDGESLRRQDIQPLYYRNGCFYAVKTKAFLEQNSFMVHNKKGYVMDINWLVNIDIPRDFALATVLYEDWKNENNSNRI
jgi:CMP-N-acetylneuraminic acid synthetase